MLITPTPAGEMRYKMTVVAVTAGPLNELGETAPLSTAQQKVWAKISPLSGTERYVNAQNTADVTHEIRCRYVPFIDHTSKLTMSGRTWDLVSVLDIEEQHIELLILAHEVR